MIDKISIPPLRAAYEDWRKQLEAREAKEKYIEERLKPEPIQGQITTYHEWHKQAELQDSILLGKSNIPITKEYTVYHGTKGQNVENICKNGFEPSKGKVMALGYGIYFASSFGYSWAYTGEEQDDTKLSHIFICAILPGKTAHGRSNQPPPKGYDSQVNDVTNPSIFAIPEKYMMIPQYLVRFSKRAERVPLAPAAASDTLDPKEEKRILNQMRATLKKIETAEKKRSSKKGL
jgi:hypothetical protein